MERKTAEEIFTGSFTIWVISTKSAPLRARLQAEDLNLNPSEVDENVNLGTKDMINDQDRIFLNSTNGQIQNFMRLVSRRFFGRGLYAVPENRILACQEGLTRIKEDQKRRVEDFLSRYAEIMKRQKKAHPNLINEIWPTADEIRSFYRMTWKVFQLSAVEMRSSDPEELITAKMKFQEDLSRGYEELKDQILGQSYMEILNAVEAVSAKIDAGEKITETNFKRPRVVLDQYLSISAIFDLPEIQKKIETLRETMTGTSAKDLREKPFIARMFATKVKDLGKEIETMTGFSKDGRMKRTVDLNDTTDEAANA